ncbi:TIGR02530 family flagellar biosynthesis protein [Sporolactobacillus terrae]|uniref:Flagellar operon protein n=1 Tax=Sporolactobacillus terrae TaxID=269673 RepID=A0A410D8A8_9BACL|nr:TIGR02530 family flagellar biosynthesis protein [Sporolactobacillus terrae]QAA22346.1 flagellar operon protein [Sporolactobacillus terrae]QAA25322.1 flagellar operon protein [Sporolactobacillus terrae]UAK17132.1 flagellar operon protein [Sporolactobacillus terrae]BBN98661.1 hypothetical protein St703_13660 [Sporolactobacillus terrae]
MSEFQPITYSPLLPVTEYSNHSAASKKKTTHSSFANTLEREYAAAQITISKHARDRINQRHINISDQEWHLIDAKVQEAKKMGIDDSLVLTKKAALLVSAKNNTVITAMGLDEAKSRIFSNINGTILINQ